MKTYNNRLEDIAKAKDAMEVMTKLEKYQNKFIRQNEVINILIHDINGHEGVLASSAKENPVASDHRLFEDHCELRGRMEISLKRYNKLKPKFMRGRFN